MTDKEFWAVMAINVEQARTMPWFVYHGGMMSETTPCSGLCDIVNSAVSDGLIDDFKLARLRDQIKRLKPKVLASDSGHFWTPHSIRPRVRAMKKLSRMVTT